ncbi:Ras-related protein Rab-39B [Echinococcus granulosus]|uniref:Ras-related protein Rab-39B n=2 Tax=Echinococcus granulosus TaxID=6210 RepID=W6UYT8_ECHGR|nr:Ras-related protein Rab-39B [Echinococcus granulosus]EUB58744.1 Ras-related protein Rab-39B [Echinococcus granulosus]
MLQMRKGVFPAFVAPYESLGSSGLVPMTGSSFSYQFRFILIGDSTVGKSSLLQYFCEGKLSSLAEPTVGVDFSTRNVVLSNGIVIKLRLWDTAGQEKFKSIARSYYRNAVGALLIFDITNRTSFEHIMGWYEDAATNMKCQSPMFLLCGQKSDLESHREVARSEAEALAQSLGIPYIETSALQGHNVEVAFKSLTEAVYQQMQAGAFRNLGTVSGWDGIKEGYDMPTQASRTRVTLVDDRPPSSSCC